jgi:uncharacterized coiled-coil DUF342 family protein
LNIWILIVPLVAFVLLACYFAYLAISKERAMESMATSKQKKIDTLIFERDDARAQRNRLNRENIDLSEALDSVRVLYNNILAQNADLREALQEAQAEIKALQMNTIEIPTQEVKPEPPKRTRRKAGAQ